LLKNKQNVDCLQYSKSCFFKNVLRIVSVVRVSCMLAYMMTFSMSSHCLKVVRKDVMFPGFEIGLIEKIFDRQDIFALELCESDQFVCVNKVPV